jgi:hypothetical protein
MCHHLTSTKAKTKDKRQKTKDKRQKTKDKRQEAKGNGKDKDKRDNNHDHDHDLDHDHDTVLLRHQHLKSCTVSPFVEGGMGVLRFVHLNYVEKRKRNENVRFICEVTHVFSTWGSLGHKD